MLGEGGEDRHRLHGGHHGLVLLVVYQRRRGCGVDGPAARAARRARSSSTVDARRGRGGGGSGAGVDVLLVLVTGSA